MISSKIATRVPRERDVGAARVPHLTFAGARRDETAGRRREPEPSSRPQPTISTGVVKRVLSRSGRDVFLVCFSLGLEKIFGVSSTSIRCPALPTPARLKKPVRSLTRAACCMLWVTMTIV